MSPGILLAATAPCAPPRAAPEWLGLVFPLAFAGMWVLVTTLLDLGAGHKLLLGRFPPVTERLEERFLFASGTVRGISYKSALYVGIGARGLHLASNVIFRSVFHRGVPCIPWGEVRLVRAQGDGFFRWFRGTSLEVRSLGLAFTVYGRAGRAVERKVASVGAQAPAPSQSLVRERRF